MAPPSKSKTEEAEPSPTDRLLKAIADKDPLAIQEATQGWIEEATTAIAKKEREAWVLQLKSDAGDSASLRKLEKMVDQHPGSREILTHYASALETIGEPALAAEVISSRKAEFDATDKAKLSIQEGRLRAKAGDVKTAHSLLRTVTDETSHSNGLRASALHELARIMPDSVHKLGTLEHAIQLDPPNSAIRFSAAYAYSEQNVPSLAILHYRNLTESGREGSAALNNLAVELRSVDLDLYAVKYYKKAVDQRSALAAGNLADILIGAGFADEALEWVAKGMEIDTNEQRVAGARSLLTSEKVAQEERLAKLCRSAGAVRNIFVGFHDPPATAMLPDGEWSVHCPSAPDIEVPLEFKIDGDVAKS